MADAVRRLFRVELQEQLASAEAQATLAGGEMAVFDYSKIKRYLTAWER